MFAMNKAKVISEAMNVIEIEAPEKCDFFIDMVSMKERDDAPFYFEKRKGDFVMKVKVRPDFKKTYDAGGLFIYDNGKKWIKLEFELTDLGYPSVVSVVTDKVSDDCNGESMADRRDLWLQVARKGDNWTLYHSENGKKWKMVRSFKLKMREELKVGLEAQSPLGKGCNVEFIKFSIGDNNLKDMRKGK